MRLWIASLIFCFVCVQLQAQELPENLQSFLESQEEELEESQLDELYDIYENSLDLNQCKAKDLWKLQFLTALQVDAILAYRKEKGAFNSIYELQSIPEMDQTSNRLLSSSVQVKAMSEVKVKALNQ